MKIIKDGKQLSNIFKTDDRKTMEVLPRLLDKLIKASCNKNTYSCFPHGSAIFTTGPDGIVKDAPKGIKLVPSGRSVWEAGTNANSERKIRNDYCKRRDDKKITKKKTTSFVLVSSSCLDGTLKSELAKEFNKEKIFKKIKIYDANDLADWLCDHLEISVWLLTQYDLNNKEYGIRSLDEEWNIIKQSTSKELLPSIYTCGNENKSGELINNIKTNDTGILSYSSKYFGRLHAYYFVIASLVQNGDSAISDRCVVLDNYGSFLSMNSVSENKILILNFKCDEIRFNLITKNMILIFGGPLDTDNQLGFVKHDSFLNLLKESGFSNDDAERYAHISNYNPVALKRMLSKNPSDKAPSWAKIKEKYDLIPLMLLGDINMNNQLNVKCLEDLITVDLDKYLCTLNYLSEIDEPPLFNYNGVYVLGSRFECFDFVQVNTYLKIIKKIEDVLFELIFNTTNNGTVERLVCNIVRGLILIAEKDDNSQKYFDYVVINILQKTNGNVDEATKIGPYFRIFAELSPKSFLNYLTDTLANNEEFLRNYSNIINKGFVDTENAQYILSALRICYLDKNLAASALACLVDFFFKINSREMVQKEIQEIMSPIASVCGIIAIPLKDKNDFFYKYIAGKDNIKIEPVIESLSSGFGDSVFSSGDDYYRNFKKQTYECTYDDVFDAQEMAFNWLLMNGSNKKEYINNLFQNIHHYPFKQMKREFEKICAEVPNLSSEEKEDIRIKAISTKENIIRFSNWRILKDYIPILENVIKLTEPDELYDKVNYILRNDFFPLNNPPDFDDPNHQKDEDLIRNSVRKETIQLLFDKYGQKVIKRIIKDKTATSHYMWQYIYELSNDIYRDIENLIKAKHEKGLRFYLYSLDQKSLESVFSKHVNNYVIYKCLPFKKEVFGIIDGKENEHIYWENNYFFKNSGVNITDVFDKYLCFNPTNLAPELAFNVDIDYDTGIKFLNRIAEIISDKKYTSKLREMIYEIQVIVKKMDEKFYSDELAVCEFKLLPIIKGNLEDYPLGIKKYFWMKPEEFADLLLSIHSKGKELDTNSIGFKIYMDTIVPITDSSFIPKEYIVQQPDLFKDWAERLIKKCDFANNEKGSNFLVGAIINVCSTCPKIPGQIFWPTKEVADILERLSLITNNDRNDISRSFANDVTNRRGIRTVQDGTPEFVLRDEYLKYADFYKYTNSVTSVALTMIADSYNFDGINDRMRANLGLL